MTNSQTFKTLAAIERAIRTALRKEIAADIDVSMSQGYLDIACDETQAEKVQALLAKVPNLRMVDMLTDDGQACLSYSY
jgi:hypothetical protein